MAVLAVGGPMRLNRCGEVNTTVDERQVALHIGLLLRVQFPTTLPAGPLQVCQVIGPFDRMASGSTECGNSLLRNPAQTLDHVTAHQVACAVDPMGAVHSNRGFCRHFTKNIG